MKLPLYQVDAFTSQLFKGNPAAVCPLESWPADSIMQQIAMENNLSETAFFVHEGDHYSLRWFTPSIEVDLCGHATLAAAHVLWTELGLETSEIRFVSKSGDLFVRNKEDQIELDFPTDHMKACEEPVGLFIGLGAEGIELLKGVSDYMVVYNDEEIVQRLEPDFAWLNKVNSRGIIVTAPGNECDFVSRFFAPASGINEDPVTGSAHTSLAPYWAEQLNKTTLSARQLSTRGGNLSCIVEGNRVKIAGKAKTFMSGFITL